MNIDSQILILADWIQQYIWKTQQGWKYFHRAEQNHEINICAHKVLEQETIYIEPWIHV
jgi:hypothetical protein